MQYSYTANSNSDSTRDNLTYIDGLITEASTKGLYFIFVDARYMDDYVKTLIESYGYIVTKNTNDFGTFVTYKIEWSYPVVMATPTPTPTNTPTSVTPTPTPTNTPTKSVTPTVTPTNTTTPTNTPTKTTTPTPSVTTSQTATPTNTPTPSVTIGVSSTPTPTPTPTIIDGYLQAEDLSFLTAENGNYLDKDQI
jgi:hypothetical protein